MWGGSITEAQSIGRATAGDYKVDLDLFEGPLDLLLYLIRKDELDICDISIERITAQYMRYLEMMRMLDLDVAGEFLVMAATLMVIKSRALLPVDTRGMTAADDEAEEEDDPRAELVRQLVEYKKFKDAASSLMECEWRRSESFLAGGITVTDFDDIASPRFADIGLFDLLTAFQEVIKRAPLEPLSHFRPMKWSVGDKIAVVRKLLCDGNELEFSSLFTADSPRGEVIVTFLALLELLKQRKIVVCQNAAFGEITVRLRECCDLESAPELEGMEDVFMREEAVDGG